MTFERRILTKYDASTAGFDRGTRRVEQQLARLNRTADTRLTSIDKRFATSARAIGLLGRGVAGVGATLLGAQGIGAVRAYAEEWRTVERALVSAGQRVEGNQEKLARLAIRTRGDLASTSSAVSRFAKITGDGLDANIRRVETLQKLFAIGGASSAEQGSATLQLSQALRANRLGGEEFRAVQESAPTEFLDAIARRAGSSREALKELASEGKLTNEVVLGALDDLAVTADAKFAQLAVSGTEAAEVLSTGFSVFFGRLDEQFGATEGLNSFLVDLGSFLAEDAEAAATFAKSLEVAAVAAATLAGGRALGAVNKALVEGAAARKTAVVEAGRLVNVTRTEVATAREAFQARVRAVDAAVLQGKSAETIRKANERLVISRQALTAAEARATAATNALTIAQGRLSLATRVTTASINTLKTAFAFFGGVPGLIFAAVSAAVVFSDEIFGASRSVEDLVGTTDTLTTAVDDLKGVQEAYKKAIKATAGAQSTASTQIVAETKREFEAKKDLLELELKRQKALQADRASFLAPRQEALADLQALEAEALARVNNDSLGARIFRGANQTELDEVQRQIESVGDEIKRVAAESELAAIAIEQTEQALNTTFTDIGGGGGGEADREDKAAESKKKSAGASRKLKKETDALREAKTLIEQTIEREMTAEEKLAAAKQKILSLLPAIIELVGDEARAHEIAAAAIKQAEEDILGDSPFDKLGDDIAGAISQAENFEDMLNRIGLKLFEIAANDFFGSLFGNQTSGLFSGLGNIFGGSTTASVAHTGGKIGTTNLQKRSVPSSLFAGAPRYHDGGVAGLRPGEVPAILEKGEIVVPKNVGIGRGAANVTVGDTILNISEPNMSEAQLQRILAEHRKETIREIIRANDRDPSILHT